MDSALNSLKIENFGENSFYPWKTKTILLLDLRELENYIAEGPSKADDVTHDE